MKKLQVTCLAAVCTIILTASCNVGGDNPNPQQGAFLVANVSPDSPPLSFNINGSTFNPSIKYGNIAGYYPAIAGSYQFAFYGASLAPVLTSTVSIEASKAYSYFIIDSFSRVKASFVEDNAIRPSSDSVYIRFFNFSPNAGSLSLYNVDSNKTWYPSRIFNNVASNPSDAKFTRIKSGTYTLRLNYADSTTAVTKIDTLVGGHVYTIYAKGFKAGTGTQSLALDQIVHL